MKKLLCLILVPVLLLSLTACGAAESTPTETTAAPTETTAVTEATTPQSSMDALDGKKILFIGNSYTFWGLTVLSNSGTDLTQQTRAHNEGLFYHLCKQKGIDVDVTNWTFGGHNVTDIMSHNCLHETAECRGKDHMSYLTDPYYDYVCIQPFFETEYTGDMVSHLQPTVDFFREANPNVQFLLLVPYMTYESKFIWMHDFDDLAQNGIQVCNWGGMLVDIIQKAVTVPGATQDYYRCSFIISRSKEDGYHQNILAGYLISLMVYCAITGESAVGQPYEFCDDKSLNTRFGLESYLKNQYTYEPFTNFVEVFRSEADMLGLQQLTDLYLAKFNGGS